MDENEFIAGERKIRKKYDLLLLVELLNYYYQNNISFKVSNIMNSLQDAIVYDKSEKEELIKEAKKILEAKYNIKIESKS